MQKMSFKKELWMYVRMYVWGKVGGSNVMNDEAQIYKVP